MNIEIQPKGTGEHIVFVPVSSPTFGTKIIVMDAVDLPFFCQYHWLYRPRERDIIRAVKRNGKTKFFLLHRELMGATEHLVVDHKNGDRFDFRRANLRFATDSESSRNCKRKTLTGTSKYKGVYARSDRPGRFRAEIWVNSKKISIGTFASEEQAAKAYDAKARELHGEFACVNFPQANERGGLN